MSNDDVFDEDVSNNDVLNWTRKEGERVVKFTKWIAKIRARALKL